MDEKEPINGHVLPAPNISEETWAALQYAQDAAEKESGFPGAAPEQPTPLPSLKAGVTTETFWPKETVPVVSRIIDDAIHAPESYVPIVERPASGQTITCVLPKPDMERRVKKLEEQMDALLQRIADYNFKAQHKI